MWALLADRFPSGELRRLDIMQGDRVIAGVMLRPPFDGQQETAGRMIATAPKMLGLIKDIAGRTCDYGCASAVTTVMDACIVCRAKDLLAEVQP
jgi:hypothetical protein